MGVIWGHGGNGGGPGPLARSPLAEATAEITRESVPAVYAAQLVQLAGRFHVSARELLSGTGIPSAALDDPDGRVTPLAMATLTSRAMHFTREPGLGYYFGLHLKLSSHGHVGVAAMTASTLREAIDIAQRFVGLRDPYLFIEHYIEHDQAVIELCDILPQGALRVFVTESLCTAFAHMGRTLLGRSVSGFIDMAFPEPPYFQGFAHLLPGPVRFNQEKNRILFPRSMLDESLAMADPVAARQALVQCEEELSRLGETSSLLSTLRRELKRHAGEYPTLEEMAEQRHVSPRTLKRKLAAHGTSYRQVVDELRRERAVQLLEKRELSVERIAELLGYSDASNFQRAFRRWLGVSPAAFRANHVRERAKKPKKKRTMERKGRR